MEYFRRVDLSLNHEGIDVSADNLNLNGHYKVPQKYGLALLKIMSFTAVPNSTYEANGEDKARVLECLPESLLAVEVPEVWIMIIKPTETDDLTMLAPHVDKVRKCCLNIYIEPHGEKTSYYEYQHGKIEEKSSFVAQHGEVWLLNSDEPHAVTLAPPHIRRAISVSFIHTPYSEVVKHFV